MIVWTFVDGAHAAHAEGYLTSIQDGVRGVFTGWMNNALTYATELFGIVAVTGAIVTGVRYYAVNNTFEGLHYPLSDLLFRLVIPYIMLKSATTFLPGIFDFASRLAGGITGITITGPGDILRLGLADAGTLFSASTTPLADYLAANPLGALGTLATFSAGNNFFFAIGLCVLGALAAVSIALAFAFIAAELLVATVNILLTTSIGAVQLGWAAASGTQQMAAAYWSGVQMAIFRVIIIYAVASFITSAATIAFGLPKDMTDAGAVCVYLTSALAFAWAACYLALRIPSLAQHVFSGRPTISAGEVAQHAVRPANWVLAKAGLR